MNNRHLGSIWMLVNNDRCFRQGESYKQPKLNYSPSWTFDTTVTHTFYHIVEKHPDVVKLIPPSAVAKIEERIALMRLEAMQKGYTPARDE
jgi:hypothetical protein